MRLKGIACVCVCSFSLVRLKGIACVCVCSFTLVWLKGNLFVHLLIVNTSQVFASCTRLPGCVFSCVAGPSSSFRIWLTAGFVI